MVAADDPTPEESDVSIVPDPSDAIEFEPIERTSPKRSGWIWFLAVLILGGGGAGAWHYKDILMAGADMDEFPTIRAAEGPVKIRPENPGGMLIPDRDKLVYDRMKGEGDSPRLERLLPPAETPLAPPVPKPEPPSVEPLRVEAQPTPEPVKVEAQPAPKLAPVAEAAPEPVKVEAKPVPKLAPMAEPAPQPTTLPDTLAKVKAAAPTPVTPELKPAPQADLSAFAYKVQLAAVRSEELATKEWQRLQKKHNDLLGSYTLSVVRADLGTDKGVYFRLRAGPIAGEDVAKALCQNLVERKVPCLIVRPGS